MLLLLFAYLGVLLVLDPTQLVLLPISTAHSLKPLQKETYTYVQGNAAKRAEVLHASACVNDVLFVFKAAAPQQRRGRQSPWIWNFRCCKTMTARQLKLTGPTWSWRSKVGSGVFFFVPFVFCFGTTTTTAAEATATARVGKGNDNDSKLQHSNNNSHNNEPVFRYSYMEFPSTLTQYTLLSCCERESCEWFRGIRYNKQESSEGPRGICFGEGPGEKHKTRWYIVDHNSRWQKHINYVCVQYDIQF